MGSSLSPVGSTPLGLHVSWIQTVELPDQVFRPHLGVILQEPQQTIPASNLSLYKDERRRPHPATVAVSNDCKNDFEAQQNRHPDIEAISKDQTSRHGSSSPDISPSFQYLRRQYERLNPGPDDTRHNRNLHNRIHLEKAGGLKNDLDALLDLRRQITFRICMTHRANDIVEFLGFDVGIPRCEQ